MDSNTILAVIKMIDNKLRFYSQSTGENISYVESKETGLVSLRERLQKCIKSKFEYVVVVHSYGSHNIYGFDTLQEAVALANTYYEDNGFAYLYTNDPDVNITLNGGCVYYLENPGSVNPYEHPKDCKILCLSNFDKMFLDSMESDAKNESDLNALEGQTYEG